MSEEKEVGWGIFIYSDAYLQTALGAQVRKNTVVCDRCNKTVDYVWRGEYDEKGIQACVDWLRAHHAKQDCEKHSMPGTVARFPRLS